MNIGTSWHSYPKIYNVGHAYLEGFFDGSSWLSVEEKVDGSQFSFGVFGGEIKCRSKGQELIVERPEKMFARAVESVKEIAHLLRDGWTYRGEYLQSPKHNTLKYDRVPNLHIIGFDVSPTEEQYLIYDDKTEEFARIGLEVVPRIWQGTHPDPKSLMDTESILGGSKIEGLVFKRHANPLYGPDKKVLLAKHVSEAFKEVHSKEWKRTNQTGKDFVGALAERYCAEGRWAKAVQRLTESGVATNTPQDIAALIAEVQRDIKDECREEIIKELLSYAWPHIARASVRGLPDWYKNRLMESAIGSMPQEVE